MFIPDTHKGDGGEGSIGGGVGQQRSALMPFLTSPLSAQTIFDIGPQRSHPLLPLGAPALFDISAQRSDLILDRRSAFQHLHQRSLCSFFLEIDLENFVKSEKNGSIGKIRRSVLRPILLPALSAQGDFSKSLSAQGPPKPPPREPERFPHNN